MSKIQAKKELEQLIKKFEALSDHERKDYNEANTRKNFILPLFKILGWDVYGSEVAEEEKASGGRVDYSFSINGLKKFYVEAKSIKVDLERKEWAEQAIDYAWHKSVPWAVLSDFEGLKIFSAEWEETDPEMCLFKDLHYQNYLEKFDELWLLSRESIEKGDLDKVAVETGRRPKRTTIDKQLTADLLSWHDFLLKEFQYEPKNKKMGRDKLEECLQKLLNRLIFIRTTEDRGIENKILQTLVREYEQLHKKNNYLISGLHKIFAKFNEDYDSKLFEPQIIDTDKFEIVEYALAEIINCLYKTKKGVRYNFANIPADVLGSIYEQYLGNIQREGEAKDSKNKRKSQGIYYTPRYIVDYIVKSTVGEYLKDKSLAQAQKIKILDPACGSGSFLLRAFEELDSYLEKEKNQTQKDDFKDYLRKILILKDNIYGVDLDEEAVELTRLNLLLKTATRKHPLPDLASNIKNGNSLISGSETEIKKYFGKDWEKKKPFNWEEEYKDVFKQGGFDIVIGNPPYVVLGSDDESLNYYKNYKSAHGGKVNLYKIFLERGIDLLRDGGYLGFICPSNYLSSSDSKELRKIILENCKLVEIIEYSEKDKIFEGVTQALTTIILQKTKVKNNIFNITTSRQGKHGVNQAEFNKNKGLEFIYSNSVIEKMRQKQFIFSDFIEGYQGEINVSIKKNLFTDKKVANFLPLLRGNLISSYIIIGKIKEFCPISAENRQHWKKERIVFQEVSNQQQKKRIKAVLIGKDILCGHTTNYCYSKGKRIMNFSILALLNSKLINYYFSYFNNTNHVPIGEIKNIPLPQLRSEDDNKFSILADKMLKFNKELQKIDPILDKEKYEKKKREIEETDGEIDRLVYKLYNLSTEEIKIVEGK